MSAPAPSVSAASSDSVASMAAVSLALRSDDDPIQQAAVKQKARAEAGDFSVTKRIVIGEHDVFDVFFHGTEEDAPAYDNLLEVRALPCDEDQTPVIGSFTTSNIVHIQPCEDPSRSYYFTYSGSVYEAPSNLCYTGIPRKPIRAGVPYNDLFDILVNYEKQDLVAQRRHVVKRWKENKAPLFDVAKRYPNFASVTLDETEWYNIVAPFDMDWKPIININDDKGKNIGNTMPIVCALAKKDGTYVFFTNNGYYLPLDSKPKGRGVSYITEDDIDAL
jgi:hypothetical protein